MLAITNQARLCAFFLSFVLAGCGPQLGSLEKGETGKVERVLSGDTLLLDSGLRVFLAETDAPRGEDDYARQSQAELEALALHRNVQLAYGGVRRWTPPTRPQAEGAPPPAESAIAHVFVQSEGGRWFWLQHALVSRGAAFVRPRRDNSARTPQLMEIEQAARASERGMWGRRPWRTLTVAAAANEALEAPDNCSRNSARYRFIEGKVKNATLMQERASLELESEPGAPPFSIAIFGPTFAEWDGPAFASLNGARVRARGRLGVFHDEPQLCLEDARQLEVLAAR